MTDAEKAILKDTLKNLGEVELPALVDAEMAKLPPQYAAIGAALWQSVKPAIIKMIDDKINSI